MLFSTISQPLIFVWMMFCGGIIALWYGAMAIVRRLMEAGFWLSLVCDLIFGLGCAAILIGGLIIADYGRLRLYSLLGALLGAILTGFALISPLNALLNRIKRLLQEILTKLAKNRLIKVIFK